MKRFASILAIATIASTALAATPERYLISVPDLRLPQDIAADGHGNPRLRLVFDPATADVSSQKWESSNPAVATVSNDGTLELLKAGETDITVSFGGVKSIPCKLTVLPPENRTIANRNLRYVPVVPRGTQRIDKFAHLAWPEKYGDTVIALWADDKTGAYSMTSDDGPYGDIYRWLDIFEKWGGAITMGLTVGHANPNYTRDFHNVKNIVTNFKGRKDKKGNSWKEFIEAGNDIQSHTLTHCGRDGWLSTDYMWDLYQSRDQVQQLLVEEGLDHLQRSQTFIAGYGGWPPDMVSRFYTAGRNGGTDRASPEDYNAIWLTSVAGFESTDGYVRPLIDYTIEDGTAPDAKKYTKNLGGLKNVLVHAINGIAPDVHGTDAAARVEWIYDNYLHDNRHHLWYDNFTNMTSYGQERDTTEVVNKTVAPDRIAFDMTNILDEKLFDYPLTIKVRLDNSWNKLTVTQNGKPVTYMGGKPAESKLVRRGGQTYAMVKAVPDRGTVVLTKAGAEKKFSSNANLAKLEFRPNVNKMHDNPRQTIPGFDPAKTEYTVKLPPGTPTASIYGLTADQGARSKRDPLMGIIEVSAADGPKTTTITVTAEDETVKVYKVTFTVDDYAPLNALKLTAADCRGTEPNLKQVTTSELVAFTVRSGSETIDAEGKVTARNYDPDTVEWYVNGTKQEDAKGTEFEHTPRKYGTYEIQARMGKVESNKIAVAFTKGAPKPTVMILDENFSRHAVGKPVPTSDDPAANLFNATNPNISADIAKGDKSLKVVEVEGSAVKSGKAAAWTTPDPTFFTGLQKNFPNSGTEPLVVAFKTRVDSIDPAPFNPVQYHLLGGQLTAQRTHPVFTLSANRSWGTHKRDATWMPGWDPDSKKWMNVVHVLDPSQRVPADNRIIYEGVFVGNELYLGASATDDPKNNRVEFISRPGMNARHSGSFKDGVESVAILSITGGPKDLSNLGKCTTYFADVKIYRPGSWIMTPAKPAFASGEPVRINFNHHANINTIKPERVKVTDSRGTAVAVDTIKTDPMNVEHFEMTFANGALKKGETYTVDLDENVRDILDKTVYDVATFKVQ